jgi:hypothetical protein
VAGGDLTRHPAAMATPRRLSIGGSSASPERGGTASDARSRNLGRRVADPCGRLLQDLVRQGLSPEALPTAAALILLLHVDAAEREAEAA